MHSEEFKRLAVELYGYGWAKQLASATGINDKSLREMAKGYRPVPDTLAALLRNLHEFKFSPLGDEELPF